MAKQLIKASWFTPQSIKKIESKAPAVKRLDLVAQGYKPSAANSDGILLTIDNYPLAYSDIPTANKQIFQRLLWDNLNSNEDLQFRMKESRSFFGESEHRDDLEVHLKDVSHRINEFHHADPGVTDLPLLVGQVDVLDTPMGNIIYSLMKSSYIGISSRGYGSLEDAGDGQNQIVSAKDYVHICWDFVGIPAVREAMASIASYAKSSKLDEPIVQALLLSSKRDPAWGDLAKIIQEENHKVTLAFPTTIKSSIEDETPAKPAEKPSLEAINSFMIRLDVKGIPVVESREDGAYIVMKEQNLALGPFPSAEAADKVLNAQLRASKELVTEAMAKVHEYEDSGMKGKFYFDFGDKRYGPYGSQEDAQHDLEEVTQKGLFDHKEEPVKVNQKPVSQAETPETKQPVKSEEVPSEGEDLNLPEATPEAAPEDEADRAEFSDMVMLELADTLAETSDSNIDDFDEGDEDELGDGPSELDFDKKPVDSGRKAVVARKLQVLKSAASVDQIIAYEQGEMGPEDIVRMFQEMINDGLAWQLQGHYGRTAQSLIDAGICEKGRTPEDAVAAYEDRSLDQSKKAKLTASLKFVNAEDDPFEKGSEELGDGPEVDDDADLYFPEESMGDITVDEDAGTISVATTDENGDSINVELSLEDGYLTQVGGDQAPLDGEGGEGGDVLLSEPVDLFTEVGGDVSAAVDYILDLPNQTGGDATVIDFSDEEVPEDDLGQPESDK